MNDIEKTRRMLRYPELLVVRVRDDAPLTRTATFGDEAGLFRILDRLVSAPTIHAVMVEGKKICLSNNTPCQSQTSPRPPTLPRLNFTQNFTKQVTVRTGIHMPHTRMNCRM